MWGTWARPDTAVGMFLQVFWGYGLAYEIDNYAGPDPDDEVTVQEIDEAAELLLPAAVPSDEDADDDGETWDAVRAARELRDERVVPDWCRTVDSLIETAELIARYPWLMPWASERLGLKDGYAGALRERAARLLDTGALRVAAAADSMPLPAVPEEDPAFASLGSSREAGIALRGLWHKWHSAVCYGWLMPDEYSYLTYELEDRLGAKRKGREGLRMRARALLNDWTAAVVAEAARRQTEPELLLFAVIPAEKDEDGRRKGLQKSLTRWELGVLAKFMVAADWPTRTVLLKVPQLIGDRMLQGDLELKSAGCPADPADEAAYAGLLSARAENHVEEAGHGAFLPGILDDTPVSDRQLVTAADVQALRDVLDERRQLFIVFSADTGLEILPLGRIEERCRDGWRGILIAEAGDLPSSLYEPLVESFRDVSDDDSDTGAAMQPWWRIRSRTTDHPGFGEHLGTSVGVGSMRQLSRRKDDRETERNLRILALIRGVHDLREVGDDSLDAPASAIPYAVWQALLVPDQLDLRPFLPPDPGSRWRSGLDMPLGVLATAQIYTTNADPRVAGKGHSPFCNHAGDHGRVTRHYFLLAPGDLIRRTDLDWCSKCGGYAVRRLTDAQVQYYRIAHRLQDINQQLTRELAERGQPIADLAAVAADLSGFAQWLRHHHQPWQSGDTWRIEDLLRTLKEKAEQLGRYRQDGWPDTGSVIRLHPRR